MSLHQDRGLVRGQPGGSQRAAREIDKFRQIIAEAEKDLPIAEAHLETAQAILPEKVNAIPAPNEFNQAISRATAL
jgi:hypothetical protein